MDDYDEKERKTICMLKPIMDLWTVRREMAKNGNPTMESYLEFKRLLKEFGQAIENHEVLWKIEITLKDGSTKPVYLELFRLRLYRFNESLRPLNNRKVGKKPKK